MTFFDSIVQQPDPRSASGGWMSVPTGLTNCPPGLEYLSTINQLRVHQRVDSFEIMLDYDTNKTYSIKNRDGQNVYLAASVNLGAGCCGKMQSFDVNILDSTLHQVINLQRPFSCWLATMVVSSPPGTEIGFIAQENSFCSTSLTVKNAAGDVVFRIKGPMAMPCINNNFDYDIYSRDGESVVGKITKEWTGLAREVFIGDDYFGITFPMDTDVRIKAVLLGACFLVESMHYFDRRNNNDYTN